MENLTDTQLPLGPGDEFEVRGALLVGPHHVHIGHSHPASTSPTPLLLCVAVLIQHTASWVAYPVVVAFAVWLLFQKGTAPTSCGWFPLCKFRNSVLLNDLWNNGQTYMYHVQIHTQDGTCASRSVSHCRCLCYIHCSWLE